MIANVRKREEEKERERMSEWIKKKKKRQKGKPTKESLYLLTQRFLSCEPPLQAVDDYTATTTFLTLSHRSHVMVPPLRSAAWMACELYVLVRARVCVCIVYMGRHGNPVTKAYLMGSRMQITGRSE